MGSQGGLGVCSELAPKPAPPLPHLGDFQVRCQDSRGRPASVMPSPVWLLQEGPPEAGCGPRWIPAWSRASDVALRGCARRSRQAPEVRRPSPLSAEHSPSQTRRVSHPPTVPCPPESASLPVPGGRTQSHTAPWALDEGTGGLPGKQTLCRVPLSPWIWGGDIGETVTRAAPGPQPISRAVCLSVFLSLIPVHSPNARSPATPVGSPVWVTGTH